MAKKICPNTCVNDHCDGCETCLPRFLCVVVTLSAPTITVEDGCCSTYRFTMAYDCDKWSGNGSCQTGLTPLALEAAISKDAYGECFTSITGTNISAPIVFPGSVQSGMAFSVVDENYTEYDVLITRANVVPNPVADDQCSPCSCAIYLPAQLCIVMTADFTEGDEITPCHCHAIATLYWDCDNRQWTGDALTCIGHTFEVVATLLPAESGICGMEWSVIQGYTVLKTQQIVFEKPIAGNLLRGAICSGSGSSLPLGDWMLVPCVPALESKAPCTSTPVQTFETFVSDTMGVDVYQPDLFHPDGTTRYTFNLSANPCGDCGINADIILPECPCWQLPEKLLLTISSTCPFLDGYSVELDWNPCVKNWVSSQPTTPPCPDSNPSFHRNEWILFSEGVGIPVTSYRFRLIYQVIDIFGNLTDEEDQGPPDEFTCQPLEMEWNSRHDYGFIECFFPLCDSTGEQFYTLGRIDTSSISIMAL